MEGCDVSVFVASRSRHEAPSLEDSLQVCAIRVMETDLCESVFGSEGTFKGHLV